MIPEPRSPARGRITAVIVAIAMVGGALAIRELVFDDDDGSNGGGGGSTEALRVACVAELAEVCAELDANVTIANAGDTAASLIGASGRDDADLDAWITVAPSKEMGLKTKDVTPALFIAITGEARSLPVFQAMELMGRSVCRERMRAAAKLFETEPETETEEDAASA